MPVNPILIALMSKRDWVVFLGLTPEEMVRFLLAKIIAQFSGSLTETFSTVEAMDKLSDADQMKIEEFFQSLQTPTHEPPPKPIEEGTTEPTTLTSGETPNG